jgi:hypothetical protein
MSTTTNMCHMTTDTDTAVSCVSHQKNKIFCVNGSCCKEGTLYCEKCQYVSYCSTDCQKSHWYYHKLICKKELIPIRGIELKEKNMSLTKKRKYDRLNNNIENFSSSSQSSPTDLRTVLPPFDTTTLPLDLI